MSDEIADLNIIQEIQSGNKQAFDSLVIKYQYKVFRIIARYISDPSEILDATQETFIKVYKAIMHFRGDSAFYTWLYRIAVNTAKNQLITNGKRFAVIPYESDDVQHHLARHHLKEHSTPEKLLMCDEMESILYQTIEALPAELKTSLLLREIEGLSYDEIATVMHCPVGTVRSRIFRAREAVDQQVQPLLR